MDIYILIAASLLLVLMGFTFYRIYYSKKREQNIINFENYITVLTYYLEQAYEVIHKDEILTFSLEATRLPENEYDQALKKFIRLVEKMIGKNLLKEFVFFFGNYDTFLFNIATFFVSKYDSDAIREAAMEHVMDTEVDEKEG
ncbi:MAG: hypothetical protein ACTSXD_01095 [Candidatus Heimdallarchaeaceae archaeon]